MLVGSSKRRDCCVVSVKSVCKPYTLVVYVMNMQKRIVACLVSKLIIVL